MTAARRHELALLEAAIEREQAAMEAESPAFGECACCPECWRWAFMRERCERQRRREAWRRVLLMKIARHDARVAACDDRGSTSPTSDA